MFSRPDEFCDLPEALDAWRAQDDGEWMRDTARQLGLSEAEVDELMQPMGRVDH